MDPGAMFEVLAEDPGAAPDDVWFDTAAGHLARVGCSVRRRRGGGWLVTIPHPDPDDAVGRDTVVLVGVTTRAVPDDVVGLVRWLTRGHPLVAVDPDDRPEPVDLPGAVDLPDDVVRRPSARSMIRTALATSSRHLSLHLPAARLGVDPEGVHQARVATRRLRSDLRTFGPLLDDEWASGLRSDLGWLAGHLGAVRDADVMRERLSRALDEVAGVHEVDPAAAASILECLERQRDEARSALLLALDDPRAVELAVRLDAACVDPPTIDRALARPDRWTAPLVRRRWDRLVRAVDALDADPSVADLHRIRLLAKRARYAAETTAPAVGRPARRFAKDVARLQTALGELQDAHVAAAWLSSAAHGLDPAGAHLSGRIAQHLLEGAREHRGAWRRHLERAARAKRTSWLAGPGR